MVTPKLEELILSGRAFFKTFVAGGTKHTLTFGNDRFIIITDITYFAMNVLDNEGNANHNTQVAIYGERGYNHFIFRNYNNTNILNANVHGFSSPTTIHTYLLHEQQVGFSFGNAPFFQNVNIGVADTKNPGYNSPLEYGIEGQPNPQLVITSMDTYSGTLNITNNLTTRPAAGLNESQQLFFAFTGTESFTSNMLTQGPPEYPLLHVNYVEVLGSANNIQI
jgi:hypothetical protein